MSQFWNLKHHTPQRPGPADKAQDQGPPGGFDLKEKESEPTFEVDFSVIGNSLGEFCNKNPVSSPTQTTSTNTEQSLAYLEVGQPGNFEVKQHDLSYRLETQREQEQVHDSPQASLVMLDEPMPEMMSGHPALQDLFVSEVLKGSNVLAGSTAVDSFDANSKAQSQENSLNTNGETQAALSNGVTRIASNPSENIVDGKAISGEKTQILPEIVALQKITSQTTAAPPEKTLKVEENVTLSETRVESKQKAGQVQIEPNLETSTIKVKPVIPQSFLMAQSQAPDFVRLKNRNRDVRMILPFFVVAFVIFASGLLIQLKRQGVIPQFDFKEMSLQKFIALIDHGFKFENPDDTQSLKTFLPTNSKALSAKKIAKDVKKIAAKKSTQADRKKPAESKSQEFELENRLELSQVLTRPVSRYSESNKILLPLIDVNMALDRVQPRRVLVLLRNLPSSFAVNDSFENTALRELTARYYMQVGAYQKALVLFRQACPDPGESSDVEVCLHAARSLAVMESFSEAGKIISALIPRIDGPKSQWLEWLKILKASVNLAEPSLESLLRFTDELTDKGPFLTTEWNLQLSALFARVFLNIPDSMRNDYLKRVTESRKKLIETRLAPEKYGQDIGSYMFPAFLNLMFRYHDFLPLDLVGDEPDVDSELSLSAWVFNVVSLSKPSESRETRARLAPLFAGQGFSILGRLIEGQLAAQAGDYMGAQSLIVEQIGSSVGSKDSNSAEQKLSYQTMRVIAATQQTRLMPFLFVEWLFLGVKVSAGLNDKESLKTYLVALEDARRRFPELSRDFQYWLMVARANRVLGQLSSLEAAISMATPLVMTRNDLGFIGADKVWLLMKLGKKDEARTLMKQLLRDVPYHARLLEVGAEFSVPWGENPNYYLRLETDIPQKFASRGRDNVLLSLFTLRKLLGNF